MIFCMADFYSPNSLVLFQCETDYLQECPTCSTVLDPSVCGPDFAAKLSLYKNLAFEIIQQESRLKNTIKQVDSNRKILVNQTKQSLKDNLFHHYQPAKFI